MVKKKTPVKKISQSAQPSWLRPLILTVLVAGILYLARGLFIVAVVNNDPISRMTVIRELEKQQGKAALDWLITKKLVLQEARRQKIVISSKEVNTEIQKMEATMTAQGQSLEQALALQGLSKESFQDRIKISKIIQKMFEKEVVVTEQEIDAFLEENKESIPETADPAQLRVSVREQLRAQKIDQKGNQLIQKLKKDAKIYTFVNY